ncbi:gamma-2-syntrophin isoform X4 [Felis catus]|uniref:gamma-2-syntrophin isoform X4 n=1 Tax=Felis catus TaxID=9685 RepID=UPI001D1A15E4|nr:gamma-2-syntrophin isoform X4 [Felis catus]
MMRQPVTVPSAFPAESLVDSRLCRRKTPTHRGIYVPSVSALGRDETCSQRSAKYLERPGRSPRESVNGRELGLLFTVTPSRAVRDTETVRSITLKPASPTRGSLSACDDTNGHQLKMLQPQDTQNTVLPLISTRVTDSHACAKGAQNRYAAQTARWRLGPERKGRRRAQGPCRHIKDIQRPRRSGAFQVLAVDGVRTGVLQFHTARESADWLRAVSATISDLTLESMKMVNEGCSPCDQVVHMGWVRERLEGTSSRETFRSKFLALKGSLLYVFSTAPVSTLDWVRAEKTYNLCEVLFKLHKLWLADDGWLHEACHLGPPGFAPQRPFSFSVLVGHGQSRVFSVDLGSELAAWERSFQRATFKEVQRSRSKTYTCSWQGEMLCFTVDFALGFTCSDSKTKNVLWRFKFSQLKGSSDDGNARVKLLFQHPDTKQIEVKELEFPDLTAVLHCVHAFLAAKVASVDPAFMDSQSFARKSASAER